MVKKIDRIKLMKTVVGRIDSGKFSDSTNAALYFGAGKELGFDLETELGESTRTNWIENSVGGAYGTQDVDASDVTKLTLGYSVNGRMAE